MQILFQITDSKIGHHNSISKSCNLHSSILYGISGQLLHCTGYFAVHAIWSGLQWVLPAISDHMSFQYNLSQLFFFNISFADFLTNGSFAIFSLAFSLMLLNIYHRFCLINKCIEWEVCYTFCYVAIKYLFNRKHFVTDEEEYERQAKESIPLARVQSMIIMKLADLHDGLVDVVNQINYCYSIQVFIWFIRDNLWKASFKSLNAKGNSSFCWSFPVQHI